MHVLGIESSCDETACSVVCDGKKILSSVISSQYDLHGHLGGVVPELACRRHVEVMFPIIEAALEKAGVTLAQIDLIAVARGPGLIGALLIGLHAAKTLSLALDKPLIGVNHIEAHIYAALMSTSQPATFPCLGVVLSGGHTALMKMHNEWHYELIGSTIDDAIGEAFDKTARLLGLPYPGGPEIERLALQGDPTRYAFRAGAVKKRPLDFSFSGLKTALLYAVKDKRLSEEEICDLAASFQQAAFRDVFEKVVLAADELGCRSVLFGGGVTNSKSLRSLFSKEAAHLNQSWPSAGLSLDNAAMIAGLGYHLYQERGYGDSLDLEACSQKIRHSPVR